MRKIYFLSQNKYLFQSLKRAFKAIANIELIQISNVDFLIEKDSIILFEGIREADFYGFRNKIRFENRLLNPIAAFCYEPLVRFSNASDEHHLYFSVPFGLIEIITNLKKLKPLASDKELLNYFDRCVFNDEIDHHQIQSWIFSHKCDILKKYIKEIQQQCNDIQSNEVLSMIDTFDDSMSIVRKTEKLFGNYKKWRNKEMKKIQDLNTDFCVRKDEAHILVIDDELEKFARRDKAFNQFFHAIYKKTGLGFVFITDPEKLSLYEDTKFAFLDLHFQGKAYDISKEVRKKLDESKINYIVFSIHSQKPLERDNMKKIKDEFNELQKQAKKAKCNDEFRTLKSSLGVKDKNDVKKEINDLIVSLNNPEKYLACFSNSSSVRPEARPIQNRIKILLYLNKFRKLINKDYPDSFLPSFKESIYCKRYIQKSELGIEKQNLIDIINRAVKADTNKYYITIDESEKKFKVIDLKNNKDPVYSYTLNEDYWEIFKSVYDAYPQAYKPGNSIRNIKHRINSDCEKKTGIKIFERTIRNSGEKLAIPTENSISKLQTPVTSDIFLEKNFVIRQEFDELKAKVNQILEILSKKNKNFNSIE